MAAAQMEVVVEERRSLLLDVPAAGGVDESGVREEVVASGDKNLQGAPGADEEAIKDDEEWWWVSRCTCVYQTPTEMQYYYIYHLRVDSRPHSCGLGTVGRTDCH